ncbi:hypothetical protein JG687_00002143 [Phytophthora cactorum]|uniref:WD40-repeat-containing domain n=1 Tax=Phytophthora cactorum TaxID=29920 RepID=A0A8T1UW14_9STRA|nr:hypothetical protein JG687_00002143 [Phytophthora cactorum]
MTSLLSVPLEVRGACNKVLVKLEEGKNLFQITHPGAIKALTRGVPVLKDYDCTTSVFMTAFTDACMVWPDRLARHDGDEWARQETKAASCSTKRPWPMKRGQAPITAFFQRKQVRRISIESVNSDSDNDDVNTSVSVSTSSTQQLNDAIDPIEDASDQDESESLTIKLNATARREAREDLTGILQRRELVGCASTRQFIGGWQGPRRRRKQQLVRWALTHFQRLPMELQLAPHWERQAGAMNMESFYTSCLEFDTQGVLLAAGASNGIIALYDFDDVFHRSLNLGQKVHKEQNADKGEGEEEQKMKDEILHPIHTIFTPFEVKRIRWNPLNEDEIACSFTNRNEIYMFDLRKFPSKPHKVLKSSNQPSSGYNDLLYLPATQSTVPNSRQLKAKSASKAMNIIAGDMDGAIRMWDPRFPLRPVWSFLAGSLPINALLLSPNKQFLICGNEAGMLMTYDIQHKVVPAFGSKPVPQRKASFNIMEVIKRE